VSQQATQRLKLAKKLVRVRQQQLDQEVAALADVRRRKEEAKGEMQKAWAQYMSGVDKINRLRTSGQGALLDAIEKGLDLVKQRWVDWLGKVKLLDQNEQAQMQRVQQMRLEVNKTERLEERSQVVVNEIERKAEQKILDEFAVRRFMDQRRALREQAE
jgi:flagellar biosynthesis chaperone FliJ